MKTVRVEEIGAAHLGVIVDGKPAVTRTMSRWRCLMATLGRFNRKLAAHARATPRVIFFLQMQTVPALQASSILCSILKQERTEIEKGWHHG